MLCTIGKLSGILSSFQLQSNFILLQFLKFSKLASMKAGYSHKTASPFADMLAFRKVTCFLDLNIYLRTKEMYTAKLLPQKEKYQQKQHLQFLYRALLALCLIQVKARLGGRLRLLISGGAPLSNEIEEFMRVTTCAYFIQGYGNAYKHFLLFQINSVASKEREMRKWQSTKV